MNPSKLLKLRVVLEPHPPNLQLMSEVRAVLGTLLLNFSVWLTLGKAKHIASEAHTKGGFQISRSSLPFC